MTSPLWIEFRPSQPLPKERHSVLLRISPGPESGLPALFVAGYLRYASNDPEFITPGFRRGGRRVTHWRDCLPSDFAKTLPREEH